LIPTRTANAGPAAAPTPPPAPTDGAAAATAAAPATAAAAAPAAAPGEVQRAALAHGAPDAERPQVVELLDPGDAAWRVERWSNLPPGLAHTHPQVFHPLGRGQAFGIYEAGELVCHAASHTVHVGTHTGSVDVALLGALATAPHARRRGLASSLVEQLCERARLAGHDAVLMWSDQPSLGQRLGFAPAGRQLLASLRARCDTFVAGVRPAQAGDLPAILELHCAKPAAVERDLRDLALQLSAKPMTAVVLERDGGVVAYACCRKGLDFLGCWHEVGGADEAVARLIRGAMDLLGQSEATILLPPDREPLLRELGRAVVSCRESHGAQRRALTQQGELELFVDGLDRL
jgi:GNAT superfamily N-acetyltransferase